jgi:uncharacterized membrane protein
MTVYQKMKKKNKGSWCPSGSVKVWRVSLTAILLLLLLLVVPVVVAVAGVVVAVLIILIAIILAPSFPPTLLARTEITESYCTKVL